MNYICCVQHLFAFTSLMVMVSNFAICKFSRFFSFYTIPTVRLLMAWFCIFFFQSELSSTPALVRIRKTFSCNLHLCIPHAFFYTTKCPYRRHWIPSRNMFIYIFCGWFLRIICTPIYYFNQRFQICITSAVLMKF